MAAKEREACGYRPLALGTPSSNLSSEFSCSSWTGLTAFSGRLRPPALLALLRVLVVLVRLGPRIDPRLVGGLGRRLLRLRGRLRTGLRTRLLGSRSLIGLPGRLLRPGLLCLLGLLGFRRLVRTRFTYGVLRLTGPLLLTRLLAVLLAAPLLLAGLAAAPLLLLRPLLALVLSAPLLLTLGAPRLRRLDALALGGPRLLRRVLTGVLTGVLRLGLTGRPVVLLALVPALLLRPLLLLALTSDVPTGRTGRTSSRVTAGLALTLVVLAVLALRRPPLARGPPPARPPRR